MPRKQSAIKKNKSKRNLLKKRGSIKRRKSRVSHGKNNRSVDKMEEIYNKFIVYLKNIKGNYVHMKEEYDCVTNPKNSNYSVVKDAIINYISKNELDKKPDDFDTSNNIEESLLDFIPLDCENES